MVMISRFGVCSGSAAQCASQEPVEASRDMHCIGEVWLPWLVGSSEWSLVSGPLAACLTPWPLADAPIASAGARLADGHLPADGFGRKGARLPPGTPRVLGSWQVTSAGVPWLRMEIALANLVAMARSVRPTLR